MKTAIEIIAELEKESSRNSKIAIMADAFLSGHRELFIAARLALDPMVTYGVKLVPKLDNEDDPSGYLSFEEFLKLAADLQHRRLTGHAARDAMADAADRCNARVWNTFYRRVLLKDFKCGMDVKTLNKALKGVVKIEKSAEDFIVPIFSCQLAHDGNTPEHEKKLCGKKLVDIKLDGARLLTILIPGQPATQCTRDGTPKDIFPHLLESFTKLAARLPGPVILDGEIMAASFQELMTQFNRKKKVDTSTARLAIFDIIPYDDFMAGRSDITQEDRHAMLCELEESGMLQETCGAFAYVVPKVLIDLDTPEGRATLSEFNAAALEAGYEGVMLKDPRAPYRCTRTDAWLKIKPWISVTMEILGYYLGKADGKFSEALGGFHGRGMFNEKVVVSDVGGGFTEDQRREFWANREEMVGLMMEVEGDGLTQNSKAAAAEDTDIWSIRFPVFKGLRGHKPGEII